MSDGDGEITVAAAAAAAPDCGESPLCRELTVVDSVAVTPIKTTPLDLPQGWTVKKVPRPDGSQVDKYYYEPGTGQRFKSLRAVQRYLTDANCTPPKASEQDSSFEKYYERRTRRKVLPLIADDTYFRGPERKSSSKASSKALKVDTDAGSSRVRKSIVSGGMLLKLDNEELVVTPHAEAVISPFNLPDGWVVEEVPRRNSTNNYADKYYYEPGTRRRFVSLVSVKRHLAKAEEDKPLAVMFDIGSRVKREAEDEENKPLAAMFNIGSHVKKLDSRKKSSKEEVTSTTFGPATPPDKIKWVLTDDSGGSTFKPCIGEAMVSDPIVQRWAKRFMISISGKNNTSPSFDR